MHSLLFLNVRWRRKTPPCAKQRKLSRPRSKTGLDFFVSTIAWSQLFLHLRNVPPFRGSTAIIQVSWIRQYQGRAHLVTLYLAEIYSWNQQARFSPTHSPIPRVFSWSPCNNSLALIPPLRVGSPRHLKSRCSLALQQYRYHFYTINLDRCRSGSPVHLWSKTKRWSRELRIASALQGSATRSRHEPAHARFHLMISGKDYLWR